VNIRFQQRVAQSYGSVKRDVDHAIKRALDPNNILAPVARASILIPIKRADSFVAMARRSEYWQQLSLPFIWRWHIRQRVSRDESE
jgi:hypothetical protein